MGGWMIPSPPPLTQTVVSANGIDPAFFVDGPNHPARFIYASHPFYGLATLLEVWAWSGLRNAHFGSCSSIAKDIRHSASLCVCGGGGGGSGAASVRERDRESERERERAGGREGGGVIESRAKREKERDKKRDTRW
jgi:hypothetical protein